MAGAFNSGTLSKLQKFGSLIERFREQIANENAYDAAVIIARSSGIIDDLSNDETPEGVSRKENIQELLNGIKDFSETAYKEGKDDKLPAFLEGVALLTDQDGDKEGDQNKVTLMTIHASKGLEFSNVFITGLEEELFPAQQCVTTPAALEERRLFYVALTRAEKRAFMSFATSRYKNGQVVSSRPSRFIGEIDQEFLEGYIAMREEPSGFKLKTTTAMSGLHKPAITLNKPATIDIPAIDRSKLKPIDSNQVVPGMIIFHPTFGAGKVINLEGLGVQKKAKVVFREGGSRTLLLKFAKLYIQAD